MMIEAIGGSLPLSVGVALSPLPVAAVIMMLITAQGRTNAPAFLLGWFLGILTVGFVVFLMPGIETARGEPTTLSGLLRIILGIALLFLSIRKWRQRPAPDEPVEVPKVLTRLDQIGVMQSMIAGFLLSSVNPKNLLLTAAGAATIDASMLDPGAQIIALLVFAAIASVTIAVPVVAYLLARHSAGIMFVSWKDWLLRNNATLQIVLLLVFGALLIGGGMKILAA
jgi:threonine/homoserine/homoserine lactone efflux protein